MNTIADLPTDPLYTIKTVCSETGIRAVTLRAWERRYALLTPRRGENQYRRYSQQDIAVLRWIKAKVDSGTPISLVVLEFKSMQAAGRWPEELPGIAPRVTGVWTRPPVQYAEEIFQALIHHQETTASEKLREAQNQFDLNTLCLDVIIPFLWKIGDAWERGEIRIATEHFASAFVRGKLLALLQSYPLRRSAPKILCGCAQGEFHEIGSLILAIMLRQNGFRVEYLGPDLPNDDLVEYASFESPDMICLGATIHEAALNLRTLKSQLEKIERPPLFGFGGGAFNRQPGLRERVPGLYLGDSLDKAVQAIGELLDERVSKV
jgi:MerR family transcriptional regulator, light-induced transcriptional regulator